MQGTRRAEDARILVVDDDARLRRFVADTLELEKYSVALAEDAVEAEDLLRDSQASLVILDLVMPGLSGIDFLRRLRATSGIPVIILTARDGEDDKVRALREGADDYLVKPFSSRELVARVEAVLRRARGKFEDQGSSQTIAIDGLQIIPEDHTVFRDGKQVDLTRTEYALLLTLARSAGRVFTPADLLSRVWGPEYRDQGEILRTNIYRLRQKVEEDSRHPKYIRTRSGVGYFFARPS